MLHQLLLPKRAHQCAACGLSFAVGSYLTSCLKEGEKETYERKDLCSSCVSQELLSQEWVAVWRSPVPPPQSKPKKNEVMSGRERALALLRGLCEKNEVEKAYLLALYLERRKVLQKVTGRRGDLILYRLIAGEQLYVVPKLERLNDREKKEKELLEALFATR
ncbi:MAG: hypothetical protein JSR80_06570 [Verrucomicrobia bacterium]|nr:hypothetical protein [Verrucomicrobiota bacterium]